jgi:acyl transferase domain-containing protein
VRLACTSLLDGHSDLAVAGGVSLILDRRSTEAARRFGALSPDHRCFTFDARANGYVRGEGGGLVLLKPAERAYADGDRVYAVISGGAVSNDGGGGSLTVPRVDGQVAALEAAYRDAGVDVCEVDFVELHGTGTTVGDPVEAAALGRVFLDRDRVLPVGSVKTNIGHLEGAAGIAGLIKVVLATFHRQLPPNLNFELANPAVDLQGNQLEVVTELRRLPDRTVTAGVSSFGMGGTNCHLVVRSARSTAGAARKAPAGDPSKPLCWLVSAASAVALGAQVRAVAGAVDRLDPEDVAATLACGRTPLAHRIAVLGATTDDLRAGLDRFMRGRPAPGVLHAVARPGPTAFLFTGQGAQRMGMGQRLGVHPSSGTPSAR